MFQSIIQRTIKMFSAPDTYWNELIAEPGDIKSLLIPQMILFAAIPAIAHFLNNLFYGHIMGALVALILTGPLNIGCWIGLGYIIDFLAPTFDGQRDLGQSMKLAAGAIIPGFIGQILFILPLPYVGLGLGGLGALAGSIYGGYLLFRGLPVMNSTPDEKSLAYTIITILSAIVLFSFVIGTSNCLLRCGH
jgi:hypothetical protein